MSGFRLFGVGRNVKRQYVDLSRLRVGEVRVFYDVFTTVEILAIVAKSEAESWLAQFANPE